MAIVSSFPEKRGLNTDDINDIASGEISNGFVQSSNCYSTTETVIGKWVDGKPVYQKVFPIMGYGSKTVTTGISNLDTLIQLSALCTDGGTGSNAPYKLVLSTTGTGGRYMGLHVNGSSYDCYVQYEANSIYTTYGIAQYTKTTD